MSYGNPVIGPCFVPCFAANYGPIPCPDDVSNAFSTRRIVEAVVAYKNTFDSLREKLCNNGDKDEITKAEKTNAEKTNAEKTNAEKTDAEKTNAEKTNAEKTDAEKTLKASLHVLAEVCEDYISEIVAPVVDVVNSRNRDMWIIAHRDLENAIFSTEIRTDLLDNSTKAVTKAYYMTRSAIGSIENAIETLSTIEVLNAIKAIKSS